MLRWALYGLAGIAAFVVLTIVVGWSLPVAHRASATRSIAAPPEQVFAVITDFARYPEWRTGVTRVDAAGAPKVGQLIREFGRNGEIPYRVQTLEPPRRLVMAIAGSDLPFGGTWTYDLRANATGGTDVTITEHGEIYTPVFRTRARFVFGYEATMNGFLTDLENRGGRSPFPQNRAVWGQRSLGQRPYRPLS
ncbi:MAG TPA: SRPBCC family protein, partial [Vicinamibacterales bacterium]|nr:SRPBCC family protein [Vicinamibacterales bacterium]